MKETTKNKAVNPTLLEIISEEKFLLNAWDFLNKSNRRSRGLSSETIADFESHLQKNIAFISQQLKQGAYKFSSVRGVLIEKPGKTDKRPLRISEVRDRLVLKAISMKIDEYLKGPYQLDNECSFAYRPARNVEKAILKMVEHYQGGNRFILEADIEKFFDKVDKGKLLPLVYKYLPDESLHKLIQEGLSQEIANLSEFSSSDAHYFEGSDTGIPQGNSLSPLFANIYLSAFDQRMIKEGFKMVRYADDFIILTASIEKANIALDIAKQELEDKLTLKIHPLGEPNSNSKTRIIDPSRHKFTFLSIRFDGKGLWVSEKKITAFKEKINLITDSASSSNLLQVLTRMRNLLEGWLSSFKFVEVERCYNEIDEKINIDLLKVFTFYGFYIRTGKLQSFQRDKRKVQSLTFPQRIATGIKTCKGYIDSLENRNQITLIQPKSKVK